MQRQVIDILDGAMGTVLEAQGVRVDGPAWASRAVWEAPEAVAALHEAYAAAGATLHTANTFRATRRALRDWSHPSKPPSAERWVAEAVALARGAVPRAHSVLGSLASVADCYAPAEVPGDVREEHRAGAASLAAAGVDVVLCETFASEREALVAVEEAGRTGLPVWLSLTAGPSGTLLSPREMARIARRAVDLGAARVVVGCTPARVLAGYLRALVAAGIPAGAAGNAGAPEDRLGYLPDWGPPAPTEADIEAAAARYALLAAAWIELGAEVVGGCCGTTPAHIRHLAAAQGCHKTRRPLH